MTGRLADPLRAVLCDEETVQFPLASVVDILAYLGTDATVAYHALLTPKLDRQPDTWVRIDRLGRHPDTVGQRLASNLPGEHESDPSVEEADSAHGERIESIQAADTPRSLRVNGS